MHEFGGFWTKGEQRREVLRFVWSSVRLHTVTNKLPRFTGYNSGGTSSTRGKRKMRENGDGQERIVYVRTGKRTGSRGTYIVCVTSAGILNFQNKQCFQQKRHLFNQIENHKISTKFTK
ncbi:uncharacterized protein LOC102677487 [Apis dorsata]|uniref:uncharacterized protein LOC102677487 n=1 Tax=Apis dorsata TaxID=7462 RepID=UPI001292DD71|nr:uncharacterized protein LOC102677487 [Apis dorsata]